MGESGTRPRQIDRRSTDADHPDRRFILSECSLVIMTIPLPRSSLCSPLRSEGLLYWQEVEIRRHEWGNTCSRELAFNYSLLLCSIKGVDKTSRYVLTYKTCRLHSSWQHACRREASKNKFYHVLNTLNDASGESLKGQRGLCVETTFYLASKNFVTR